MKSIVGMSVKELESIGQKAIDGIPLAHNRIRKGKFHDAIIRKCRNQSIECEGSYHVGDIVIYTTNENLGTKKYPYVIKRYDYCIVARVGQKSVFDKWGDCIVEHRIIGKIRQ